jgi:hypothetical protein
MFHVQAHPQGTVRASESPVQTERAPLGAVTAVAFGAQGERKWASGLGLIVIIQLQKRRPCELNEQYRQEMKLGINQ